jgi:hypothetical protein
MVTNNAINVATAATGKVLQAQGIGVTPAFSTATYPATATGTGKILRADGTNFVASTATYPDTAGTTGNVLTSDGTNWISSAGGGSGSSVQQVRTSTATFTTTSSSIPFDDTIPQNTEGAQLFSLAITPKSASNILVFTFSALISCSTSGNTMSFALFQDSVVNSIYANATFSEDATSLGQNFNFTFYMTAGTTSSTTFALRFGANSGGTTRINGVSARRFGGVALATFIITEISA